MRNKLTAKKMILILIFLSMLSIIVVFTSLHLGVLKVTGFQVLSVFLDKIGIGDSSVSNSLSIVIWDLRFKRSLLAFIVGVALSVSGVVFQALLRNPLADPHILGVSSGGALGAVIAAAVGVPIVTMSSVGVPLFSFLGSLLALFVVYQFSKKNGILSVYSLLLIGVIVNSFFISIVIFIETLLSADQLAGVFHWLLGSFSQYNQDIFPISVIFVLIGTIVLFSQSRNINIITLGEEKAQQMGVNTERSKLICFFFASVITGVSVALSGLIGFVGLVVPHISRLVFGSDNRLVLPASALLGGCFLVVADTVARVVLMPNELPVGVITSFVGAPFFIFLLKYKESRRIFL